MNYENDLKVKVLKHIHKNGFGSIKTASSKLSAGLSVEDFRQNYYDKKELMEFCREKGIGSVGLKGDLNERIEIYLETGEIMIEKKKTRIGEPDSMTGLYPDKPIINYKSDPITREFMKKHVPEFKGFSAQVQKDLKRRLSDGEKLTYNDLIGMQKEFYSLKRNGGNNDHKVVAHDSCQLNQFQIDYKRDLNNFKFHSLMDAWKLVRNSPGIKGTGRILKKL